MTPGLITVLIAIEAAGPSTAPTTGITSAQMYHRMFENGRLRTAAAMVARGDCPGAISYARRKRSTDVLAAIERLCAPRVTASVASADPDAASDIAAFAADPSHPLFELVRGDMIRFLRSGEVRSLQEAYDQAVTARAASARAILTGRNAQR